MPVLQLNDVRATKDAKLIGLAAADGDCFDHAVHFAHDLSGMQIAALAVLNPDRRLEKHFIGVNSDNVSNVVSICGQIALRKTSLTISQQQAELADVDPLERSILGRHYCVIGIPIMDKAGGPLGSLCVMHPQPIGIDDGLVRNLKHIATTIEHDLSLRSLSRLDPLTGLMNRRSFDLELDSEWRRCVRYEVPISVLMIDVDQFKQYNDKLGHQMGDAALANVASVIKDDFRRAGDLICRYGGEEFIVLLPNCDSMNAAMLAASVVRHVEALAVPHPGSAHGVVTVSVGCSTTQPSFSSAEDVESQLLIQAADTALSRAKQQGRNRVAHALNS